MVKNLPAMQETMLRSLGQEDLLEKGRAIHSSILAWRIAWTEKPGRLQSVGLQRVRHDWATNTHIYVKMKILIFISITHFYRDFSWTYKFIFFLLNLKVIQTFSWQLKVECIVGMVPTVPNGPHLLLPSVGSAAEASISLAMTVTVGILSC